MKLLASLCFFFATIFSCFAQEKMEVFFDFNKYNLNPTALTTLNDWILQHPKSKVLKIYGFCDWKGTNTYNDSLSLQRIHTIFDYLTENKIQVDEDYIQKGFGENFTQDKNQALNRKVQIIYSNLQPEISEQTKEITLSDKVKTAKKGDLIRLKNINFYNNSARIVPKSKSVLYDLLCVMQENPNLKIEIQGHICCQTAKNMDYISTARAKAIYNHLIQNKIQRNRLTYKGYGVTQPLHPIPEKNTFEEDENRRVEIKIIEN
jgi:outer membrane protein OmpA-like peptidoglycan-associated protein